MDGRVHQNGSYFAFLEIAGSMANAIMHQQCFYVVHVRLINAYHEIDAAMNSLVPHGKAGGAKAVISRKESWVQGYV